jgi:hypothetical protein
MEFDGRIPLGPPHSTAFCPASNFDRLPEAWRTGNEKAAGRVASTKPLRCGEQMMEAVLSNQLRHHRETE